MDAIDLFAEQEAAERDARREHILLHSWRTWGWNGPTVGGLCEVGMPIVATPDGPSLYCYMEQARLLEQRADGMWLAVIEMGNVRGEPWFKDGRHVLLRRDEIAPPRQWIREMRAAA